MLALREQTASYSDVSTDSIKHCLSLDDGVRGRMWSRPRRTNGNAATLCKSSYTLPWTEDATVSNIALDCGPITFDLQPVGGLS